MKTIYSFFNIPVSLCEHVVINKFIAPFRLYMYLKAICSGQMRITAKVKSQIAKDLGTNPKTINNQLRKLQEKNWIGYNPKSEYYFIRCFAKVMQIEGLKGRRGVGLSIKNDLLLDKKRFAAFNYAALIGYLAIVQKWKRKYLQKSEHSTGSSNHNLRKFSSPVFAQVACNALQRIYKISRGTAHKFKKEAAKYGYIDLKGNLDKLPILVNEVPFFQKANPDVAARVKVRKGKVYLQVADKIDPFLEYPKRRKYKIAL